MTLACRLYIHVCEVKEKRGGAFVDSCVVATKWPIIAQEWKEEIEKLAQENQSSEVRKLQLPRPILFTYVKLARP